MAQKQYKSSEFVHSDTDASSPLTEDSDEDSGANTVVLADVRDSIDRELDEMVPTIPSDVVDTSKKVKKGKKDSKKACEPEPTPIKFTYNLSLYAASEYQKDLKKRKGMNTYIKLSSDEPFDTWKAQLLVKISEKLHPATIAFEDYDVTVTFTIPRVSPSPLAITMSEDYELLHERMRKAKGSEAHIFIQEKPKPKRGRRDDDVGSESDGSDVEKFKQKKKKKTSAPKATDIDERNQPVNKHIQALRARWVCNKKPGCVSDVCFVNPADGGKHVPLTFARLECWASAMLKGPAFATLEMPPNHKHFEVVMNDVLGQTTILAERRQQLEKAKTGIPPSVLPTTTGPVINFNFPPELLQLFQGHRAPPQALVEPIVPGPSVIAPRSPPKLFLPQYFVPGGPRMGMELFSARYDLSKDLEQKLMSNGYTFVHSLGSATTEELQSIGLLPGEFGQLRDAISRWSNSEKVSGEV